jgi:hypothetical protein
VSLKPRAPAASGYTKAGVWRTASPVTAERFAPGRANSGISAGRSAANVNAVGSGSNSDVGVKSCTEVAMLAPPSPSATMGCKGAVGVPTRMSRAREWTIDVENAFRLQEAGFRDEDEARSLGHPPLERWPPQQAGKEGLIRKLATKETLGREAPTQIYFSKRRECEDKDLPRVKLYHHD